MRPTIVTGAGGFIARSLIPELIDAGHDIVAVVRPGGSAPDTRLAGAIEVIECDVADPDAVVTLVEQSRPGAIVNLAVSRSPDLVEARPVNTVGVGALVDAAAAMDAHLVHAGSSFEYGPHDTRLGASTRCRPTSALGITKLEASRIVTAAVRERRLRGCVMRLFHVYGRHEPSGRLVPRALRAARSGHPLALTHPGLGHDLIDVADVNAAILACLQTGLTSDQPIDVCTGECTFNETVVDVIQTATGQPINRRVGAFDPRDWDRPVWVGDPTALVTLLGRPPRSLADGIRILVETTVLESR